MNTPKEATVKGVKGLEANFHVYRSTYTRLDGVLHTPRRMKKPTKAYEQVHQGVLHDPSRRIGQKIKSIFKKPFSVLKMLCQVFGQLFSRENNKIGVIYHTFP